MGLLRAVEMSLHELSVRRLYLDIRKSFPEVSLETLRRDYSFCMINVPEFVSLIPRGEMDALYAIYVLKAYAESLPNRVRNFLEKRKG